MSFRNDIVNFRFLASPSLLDETLSCWPVFWEALKPEQLPVEPSGVPGHRTTVNINSPGQYWYSQGTRPQTTMTLWSFGFEAIDNDRGELKTELQAPVAKLSQGLYYVVFWCFTSQSTLFSVLSGGFPVSLGWSNTKQRIVSCSKTQRNASCEYRTSDLFDLKSNNLLRVSSRTLSIYGTLCKRTCIRGFRPGHTQTSLISYRYMY